MFRILLIEDNPVDVMVVREALREHASDYDVHVINDGSQALDLLSTLDHGSNAAGYDLIVLDLHLPKLEGTEILKRLRADDWNPNTPIVVMTAFATPREIEFLANVYPALFYVEKPKSLVESAQLGHMIRAILAGTPPYDVQFDREKVKSNAC